MKLLEQLENYIPYNEQEAADRIIMMDWLRSGCELYARDNTTIHFTASGWIVSPDRSQVLMAFHNLYHSWAWLGGHADGDHDLLHVAEKEIREESSLPKFRLVSPDIFSIEILPVFGHVRRGTYVSTHQHFNVTYLFEADPALPITNQPDENSAVGWIPVEDLPTRVSEPWMLERIYTKLNQKAQQNISSDC